MLMRLLLSATLATFAFAAGAQISPERFQAGTHYFPITPAQPTTAAAGKVEVIEVFSYACIHCAHFNPLVEKWRKAIPANVSFSYLPAVFGRADWEVFARAYFAAEALGIADKAHQDVFDGIWVRKNVKTLEDVAKVYAKYGKTEKQFTAAAKSFAMQAKINRSKQQVPRYQVDGTPAVVVAGKYRVTGASAGGLDKVFDVVNFLVAKEAASKATAPAPAVPAAKPAKG